MHRRLAPSFFRTSNVEHRTSFLFSLRQPIGSARIRVLLALPPGGVSSGRRSAALRGRRCLRLSQWRRRLRRADDLGVGQVDLLANPSYFVRLPRNAAPS